MIDVRLPGRDGPQTPDALRERDPDLACVFVTGGFSYDTREDLERRGAAVDFKPVRLRGLVQLLRARTRGPAGSGPAAHAGRAAPEARKPAGPESDGLRPRAPRRLGWHEETNFPRRPCDSHEY